MASVSNRPVGTISNDECRGALIDGVLDRQAAAVLARTAHELKQPLAAASAAFSVMRQRDDAGVRERACMVLERQFFLLSRLLDDLVETSRLRLDLTVLQRERCDLRRIVLDAVEDVRPQVTARQQGLDLQLHAKPVWVYADVGRLHQVFSNLLNNGVRYTDEGGRLSVGLVPAAGRAVVTIRDTGRGMSAEELTHVFRLFDTGDADCGHGLGIGFAVARHLVNMHGGSIHALSRGRGLGSEFVVSVPNGRARHHWGVGRAGCLTHPEHPAE